MAPEQVRGDELDARVDVYACGVVLFEMLTGTKPLTASDPIVTLKKQVEEVPRRLSEVVPGDYGALEDIVARALAKSPSERYPTAVAMAEALDAALAGRVTPEATAVMRQIASGALEPVDSSMQIPITEGSAAISRKPPPRDHDRPIFRPTAPASRTRLVLLGLLLLGAASAGGIYKWREREPRHVVARHDAGTRDAAVVAKPTVDAALDEVETIAQAAEQLAASGKLDAATDLLTEARHKYPDRALLPFTAGKVYFARFWWNDGLANLRDAIKLDPGLRESPALLELAVHAFITTPAYDNRLGAFLLELGPAARPFLDDVAATNRNPELRVRATALAKRLH
jgi:hypothetical protein